MASQGASGVGIATVVDGNANAMAEVTCDKGTVDGDCQCLLRDPALTQVTNGKAWWNHLFGKLLGVLQSAQDFIVVGAGTELLLRLLHRLVQRIPADQSENQQGKCSGG